jgi:hypothetical protein
VPVSATASNYAGGGALTREVSGSNWGMMLSMLTIMPVPDSDDILDLEPTKDGLGYVASITRRRKDGSVMWTALPPGGVQHDVWTAVRLEGPSVIPNSWSCYLIRLDLETGGETARTFTK